jgi:hypothetical protein
VGGLHLPVDGRDGIDQFFTQQIYRDSEWASIVTTDLLDTSGSMYTGFSLPNSVKLKDFNANVFELAFVNLANGDQLQVSGHFTEFRGRALAVPEPTGLSLGALGLALVAGALRRKSAPSTRPGEAAAPTVR